VQAYDIVTNTNATTEQRWYTNGCAEDPTTGAFITTGFWSNVVSRIPSGASAATKGIDLDSLTRVRVTPGGRAARHTTAASGTTRPFPALPACAKLAPARRDLSVPGFQPCMTCLSGPRCA
jgi:hypothetical protein